MFRKMTIAIFVLFSQAYAAQQVKYRATVEDLARFKQEAEARALKAEAFRKATIEKHGFEEGSLPFQDAWVDEAQLQAQLQDDSAHRLALAYKRQWCMDNLEKLTTHLPLPLPVAKECEMTRTNGVQIVSEDYEDKFREFVDLRNKYAQQYAQTERMALSAKHSVLSYALPCLLVALLIYHHPPHVVQMPMKVMTEAPAWKNMWRPTFKIIDNQVLLWGPVNMSKVIGDVAANMSVTMPMILSMLYAIAKVPQNIISNSRTYQDLRRELARLDSSIDALNKRLYPQEANEHDPVLHPYSPRLWQLKRTKEYVQHVLPPPARMNQLLNQQPDAQNQPSVPAPLHIPSDEEFSPSHQEGQAADN